MGDRNGVESALAQRITDVRVRAHRQADLAVPEHLHHDSRRYALRAEQ